MIETTRLILRPLCAADFEALCILDGDPEVRSYFPEGVLNSAEVQQELERYLKAWNTDGFGLFAAVDKKKQSTDWPYGFCKIKFW